MDEKIQILRLLRIQKKNRLQKLAIKDLAVELYSILKEEQPMNAVRL